MRVGTGGDDILLDPTFTPGDWVNVELSWDATGTTAPALDLTLNGTAVPQFTSTSADLASIADGLQTFRFKVSDSRNSIDGKLYVDDIEVTADGSDTPEFTEDFQDDTIGPIGAPYTSVEQATVVEE